ncbi:helix-turn-helix domain-containing protein [Rhizobium sp. NLR3b]|uniref:helix-turn-helix domain-containing protein n=1 Tax=Rhizobium sp. NLR3b TaxID=2731116 RepID=UPI001C83E937|nr:helix-turn-helix domain-containing protein [Rhizobium sp. NLR3b]
MKLLTIKQAAEALAVSVSTIRALVTAGELAFIQKGTGAERRHMAFDPADIEDYVRRKKTRMVPAQADSVSHPGRPSSFLAQRAARLAAKAAKKAGR